MVSVAAIVCVRNESVHIRRCLRDLIGEGLDVILIDHQSEDDTAEKARAFLGRGLLSIERLEYRGVYSQTQQLGCKHRIIEGIDHDWVVHADADEWLASPREGQSLREAIAAADAAGATCINFNEFVMVPSCGRRFDHEAYSWMMSSYYFFEPYRPRLVRAWKRRARLTNIGSGGHLLEGDDLRLHRVDFILRHYMVLSLEQARAKYIGRRFGEEDLDKQWHGNRVSITAENLRLPAEDELSQLPYPGSKAFSTAMPRTGHFWEWQQPA